MSEQLELTELTKRAQQGDREALERLAELAVSRLRPYVFRLTLQQDLAEEIVQETLLEMVKILGKLKKADRFWPWLYGIATNKLRHHYRSEQVHRKVTALQGDESETLVDRDEGIETLVTQEVKQIVSAAVKSLKTSHRAVLIMRCYDGMSYADIAQSMGCTEFGTRMLFLRAKKALEKQLARNGLKRGSLLMALVVFGKMTAPTKVAAAQIAVTAATMDVGLTAGLAGLATSKAAAVTITAAGIVTAGAVVGPELIGQRPMVPDRGISQSHMANVLGTHTDRSERHWYFLPEGPRGPLMLRAQADRGNWIILQNKVANYASDGRTLQINSHRCWASDLSVMRLPTDSPTVAEFLDRVEGLPRTMPLTRASGRGLLVQVSCDLTAGTPRLEVLRNPNVSDEDYFQSDWPLDIRQQDNRDLMHRRGWTFVQISGEIQGRPVSGQARIPFIYDSFQKSRPWLRMRVGDLTIQDRFDGEASVSLPSGARSATYSGGTFFKGLGRPWAGLHAVDVVRRDAAEKEVWFRTTPGSQRGTVHVELDLAPSLRAVHTIDLETDVVDQIEFLREGSSVGRLAFTYLQDTSGLASQFIPPANRPTQVDQTRDIGLLWLADLASGSLGQ